MNVLHAKPKLQGSGVAALRDRLIKLIRTSHWPLLEALPVTRFLGDSFGISNVSAFRVLNELSDAGHLWRAPNGRYFLPGARRLMERPAPVACLLRRLERWTEVGREIMLGVDDACGGLERAMLLAHDRVLFRQADPNAPTRIGSDQELRETMEDFLRVHSERIDGVILDELWPDFLLAKFKKVLRSAVVVYRHTKLPFLGCVSADVDGAARLAVEHAQRNNFEKLVILCPSAYQPSDEMAHALERAAKGRFAKTPVVRLDSPAAHKALLAGLQKERRRTLLVATEDNAAVAVLDALLQAGIDVPERVGLLSTMGSRIATERSITAAGFDFRRMGAEAARMAIGGNLRHFKLPPVFIGGATA
ncbi:MAG: substrate-binding domain-containing protein [Verrucomicrobiota bacterium]